MKITNLFKEKKKSNKRCSMKNVEGLDSDEEKFKEFDTHIIKNPKIKFKYPKQKPVKTQKTLNDIKISKPIQENDSKSTQAFSKKLEDLIEVPNLVSDKIEIKDVVMKDVSNKTENVFELSSKTKNILNQVLNKKKEEKQNKISNKENDSKLLLESESNSKIKKLFNHENAKNQN